MRDRGSGARANGMVARGIVAWQLALSMVLVVTAGLLVGSFRRLVTVDPGFEPEGVLLATASWGGADLPEEQQAGIRDELLARVRQGPGARDAAAAMMTPISGYHWNDDVVVEGGSLPANSGDALVWFNAVSERYFATLGTPLLAGRDFTRADTAEAPRVVVVSQALAQRFFGAESPLGRQIRTNPNGELGPPMEIVGVVENVKYRSLDEDTLATAYVPLRQGERVESTTTHLALRTDAAPTSLVPAVVEAVRDVHPGISLEFRTLHEQVAQSLARTRLLALLSGFFGSVALLLAVVGLYGTIAYDVERRRGEIGIRMAFGAGRGRILRMIVIQGAKVVAVGIGIGAMLALATTRGVGSFLYGVSASDPATLAASALLLASVALLAGLIPAWRASGIDPMATLREE
jgi:predicted permease